MDPAQHVEPAPVCANCGKELSGRYCSGCAQDSTLERVSLYALLSRGIDQIRDVDGSLVRTLVGLTLRPGVVCTEYAEGARRSYTNPIKYALIAGALMVLGIKWDPFGRARLFPEVREDLPRAVELANELMPTFIEYTQIFMLFSAPLLALLLWLFFPRTKRNFAEQCALVFFIFGHVYLMQTPFVLLGAFASESVAFGLMLVHIVWVGWAAMRFYGGRPWLTFVRASIANFLFFFIMQIMIFVYLLFVHGGEAFMTPS